MATSYWMFRSLCFYCFIYLKKKIHEIYKILVFHFLEFFLVKQKKQNFKKNTLYIENEMKKKEILSFHEVDNSILRFLITTWPYQSRWPALVAHHGVQKLALQCHNKLWTLSFVSNIRTGRRATRDRNRENVTRYSG